MDAAAPTIVQGCIQPEVLGHQLQYWGELHKFICAGPAKVASASAVLCRYLLSALWAGSQLAGAASYKTAAAIAGPLGTLLAWVGWVFASHTFQILGTLLLFVAWQTYFPSRFLIRLLAKLPYCRGVSFEFPPAPDAPVPDAKYVALTIDDGPCPYNTSAVLDELKKSGATATFFIIGSQVEKCDVAGVGSGRNGGEGHYAMGQETLRRMFTEGHELGNHTWHDRPSHALTPKQLTREILDTHKVISTARQAALTAVTPGSDDPDSPHSMTPTVTGLRTKWFRPGWGWFTPEMVEAVQKLGYHTVLGSVWPWDVYSKWPLLNALYISAKVYPGAVIVLHDRRRHLLPTLQYVLPWLRRMGYDVVNLSEAAYRSNGRGPELTPAALEAHNKTHSSLSLMSQGSARSMDGSALANMPQLAPSAAYLARMAKETERAARIAAMEEAERAHLKSLRKAEADRRAGIDRRLVDMSAAEKRAIERREREKKEAEIRRARRKIEEAKARERYDRYIKERAERHEREAKERAEAKRKAREAEERRKKAEEDYNKHKEAERQYAAEMVARQKADREAREAAEAAAAAAAATPGSEITAAASEAGESSFAADSSTAGVDQTEKKKKKGLALLKKLGGKAAQKLGVKDKSSSKGATAGAAAVAAAGAAGMAAYSSMESLGDDSSIAAGSSIDSRTKFSAAAAAAADLTPTEAHNLPADSAVLGMYGWYGLSPSADSVTALAEIDAAIAAHSAWNDVPTPVTGTYACGPGGRVLLGFNGKPLLLSVASDAPAAAAAAVSPDGVQADAQPVLLNSQGEPLVGPHGEKIVMLLGANNVPLADPHGRPVFVAEVEGGTLRGVHPDGSIITVPARSAVGAAGTAGEGVEQQGSAVASRRVSTSSASGDIAGAMTAIHHRHAPSYGSDAGASASGSGSGSIKEASSYAPSLVRSSVRSSVSSGAAAGAGLPPRSPTPTPVAASPTADVTAAGGSTDTNTGAPPAAAAAAAAVDVFPEGKVPAVLLLGPSGLPLLGLDNRPLIVAVDEEGVPLVELAGGRLLLGPDSQPLQLAYLSDGIMVALDSRSRPFVDADGCSYMVALDKHGRPMADESGHAIMLAFGPAGFVVTQTPAAAADTDLDRTSWASSAVSAAAPRMSHSGNTAALRAAAGANSTAGAGSGCDMVVGPQGDGSCSLPVVDAADYGAYSYNPATAAVAATAGAVGVGAGAAAALVGMERADVHAPLAAAVPAAADAEVVCQDRDIDNFMLKDQAAPASSAAAAAADAYGAFGPTESLEAPMSPAAWRAHPNETTVAAATAADADTAEPIGLDLLSQPQQLTGQDTKAAIAAPAAAADSAASEPKAMPAGSSTAAAAAAAREDDTEYVYDSQATTPSSSIHDAAAAADEPRGKAGHDAHTTHHQQQQQGGEYDDDLPVGKIRLSAQGVALTANSHY